MRDAAPQIAGELQGLRLQLEEIAATLSWRHRPPEAVDYVEAGRLLGFSSRSVRRLVANGTLAAVAIGSRLRIPVSEIRRVAVVGVPERSRWGKRLLRPTPFNAVLEAGESLAREPLSTKTTPDLERPLGRVLESPRDAELRSLLGLVDRLLHHLAEGLAPARALSMREAARRLSVSSKTLTRLVRGGKVRAVYIASRRMIPSSEIERLTTVPTRASLGAARPRDTERDAERAARERDRAWIRLKARGWI